MKKAISGILAACIIATALPTFAAVSFTDLPQTHWAYQAVQSVAETGVINGYDDGSFRPENTVTRAEFVKLIGMGNTVRETPYTDVDENHWGYAYIMSSGMEVEGNEFLPDQPILRGEVVDLLWVRSGKPAAEASCAVTGQWKNKDSVAWAYSTGLMIGDDGVRLRLNETLTRAEAATLIQRSGGLTAGVNNLRDHVSDAMLLQVLNGSGLLGGVTDLNAPITNGTLALAALRLETGESEPFVSRYPQGALNTAEGKMWAYVASNYLENSDYSAEKIQAQATTSDAAAVLMASAMRVATENQKFYRDGAGYANIAASGKKAMYLELAKGTGLEFGGEQPLTAREMAFMVFQLDRLVGTKVSYCGDTRQNESVAYNAAELPANAAGYPVILDGIPKAVYETAYLTDCVNDYDFTREYAVAFYGVLARFAQAASDKACTVRFTYYPSLTKMCADGSYIMRVRLTVRGNAEGKALKSVFGEQVTCDDAPLTDMFVDIRTVTALNSTVYPTEDLRIEQIVCK